MFIFATLGVAVLTATAIGLRGRLARLPNLEQSRLAQRALTIWHGRSGVLLLAYLALAVIALGAAAAAHGPQSCSTETCWEPANDTLFWLPVVLFLTWRVSRGGQISRVLLIIWSGLGYLAVATSIARVWNLPSFGLLAINAAEIALLTSPAVFQRTRPARSGGRAPGALRARPSLWLVLSGVLAGLIVTLLYLGSWHQVQVPGCDPARTAASQPPARCMGLADGYPLPFVSAIQNYPVFHRRALLKDWAQWSLVSFSALYVLWLRREEPQPAAAADLLELA
jgi:hypothetical protein